VDAKRINSINPESVPRYRHDAASRGAKQLLLLLRLALDVRAMRALVALDIAKLSLLVALGVKLFAARALVRGPLGHAALRQLHPVVDPQVSHFMQVPLRTSVKLAHSPHISPS
jgi:hypothetical protein